MFTFFEVKGKLPFRGARGRVRCSGTCLCRWQKGLKGPGGGRERGSPHRPHRPVRAQTSASWAARHSQDAAEAADIGPTLSIVFKIPVPSIGVKRFILPAPPDSLQTASCLCPHARPATQAAVRSSALGSVGRSVGQWVGVSNLDGEGPPTLPPPAVGSAGSGSYLGLGRPTASQGPGSAGLLFPSGAPCTCPGGNGFGFGGPIPELRQAPVCPSLDAPTAGSPSADP